MPQPRAMPVALTIAGSDSGGGAGLQADLKTFTSLGVFGMTAVTAITVQNTLGVTRFEALGADLVAEQMDAVLDDIGCDAAKTGMLANGEIIAAVADRIAAHGVTNLVVDPVMVSTSRHSLLDDDARRPLVTKLLPLALVATPNLHEAAELTGRDVETLADMREAARRIADLGPRAVVVKGGHLPGAAVDLLYLRDTDEEILLESERFETSHTHGTGCTFSAAIAAYLAQGVALVPAVRKAKRFISLAIQTAVPLGGGHGPTNHVAAGQVLSREE
jgi:hydroxymethylpyrimidine/phosphomethylpyrimidine kinase